MTTTRRSFLNHLLFGLVALAVGRPDPGLRAHAAPIREPTLESRLLALVRAPARARRVGQAYLLGDRGAVARARHLAELLRTGPSVSAASVAELIRQRRQRDLECDRVVFVDGWLLAQTEADLAALFVLLPDARA